MTQEFDHLVKRLSLCKDDSSSTQSNPDSDFGDVSLV